MLGTTKLGQRKTLLLAYGALLGAVVSCQIVAGIENRNVDPLDPGCVLPSAAGFPQVRIANFVPTSDVVDVCLRPAGASSWGRPVLLNGGIDSADAQSCKTVLGAAGFAYNQVSAPFSAPSGSVDVKFIAGGSTCTADAIAEGDGLTLATNAVTTLIEEGGNGMPTAVIALPEADNTDQTASVYRFVHVAPGTGPLDFGIMATGSLPTTLSTPLLSGPISYGQTIPAGTTTSFPDAKIEDNGYLGLPGLPLNMGAALDGDTKGVLIFHTSAKTGGRYSFYVEGVTNDNLHPLRARVCDELSPGPNQLLSSCVDSQLSSISVDVFNAALYGPNSPDYAARDTAVPPLLAQRGSDVMCIVEVDTKGDQDNILLKATNTTGGSGPYGYAYTITSMNLNTPFTDPTDQSGQTPPPPSAPPCSGVDSTTIGKAISCAEQYCSNQPAGDPTGVLIGSTDCLSNNCGGEFLNIQGAGSGDQGKACFNCLSVYIASQESFESMQTHCNNDTTPPLGYLGYNNSMIISKYPLVNEDVYILPSTLYRRAVLYAQVQLEDQLVDFYCGFLITTLNAGILPYTGNYGNGATSSQDGWDNEQAFQAKKIIDWVAKKSGTKPAIVVGDWRSSLGAGAGDAGPGSTPQPGTISGTFLPNALNDTTMTNFKNAGWTFAFPSATSGSSWASQCNFCPASENQYNSDADSYFVAQPMLVNFPSDSVTDESLFFTDSSVALGTDAGLGPASPYFGVNVRVIRPH